MCGGFRSSAVERPEYRKRLFPARLFFLVQRGLDHLRFVDCSSIPGWAGYVASRTGLENGYRRPFER